MDTVTILRELWRRPLYLGIVGVIALLAGILVMFQLPSFQSRSYDVGAATGHVLIDTPSSQVVDVAPKGADTTGNRADLLASLMVEGGLKADIARYAGLKPSQLTSVTDAFTDPTSGASPAASAPSGPKAFVLTTQVLTNSAGDELPIIEVDAQAPTDAMAARLVQAAVTSLRAYLNSTAALQRVPDADRLQVNSLGPPQATTEVRGPSKVIALIVILVVFLLGCAGILGARALVRGWRAAAAREQVHMGDDSLAIDTMANDSVSREEPGPTPLGLQIAARNTTPSTRGFPGQRATLVPLPPPDRSSDEGQEAVEEATVLRADSNQAGLRNALTAARQRSISYGLASPTDPQSEEQLGHR
jgi:hypothetical protein